MKGMRQTQSLKVNAVILAVRHDGPVAGFAPCLDGQAVLKELARAARSTAMSANTRYRAVSRVIEITPAIKEVSNMKYGRNYFYAAV